MKNKKSIVAGVLIFGVLVFGGMRIVRANEDSKAESSDKMKIENAVSQVPVTIDIAQKGGIKNQVYTIGEAKPSSVYNVNAKSSGEVSQVYFEVGDEVKKGDVLFVVDMTSFNIDMDKNISQLSNGVDQSKIAYENALKVYNDKQKLFESGAISNYELDNTRISFENAKIAYENASNTLNSTQSSYSKQSENYVITSPIDGVITESTIDRGMFATSQNGFTIIVKDSIVIESSIASKYINDIKPGQDASIYINTLDKTYNGKVESVSYTAKKGSYPLKLNISNPDNKIQSGMYCEISIETGSRSGAILVQSKSLISENAQDYIYEVDESNIAHKKMVKTGITNGDKVEIVEGLGEGSKIVVEGKEFLDEGKSVMIQ